MVYFSRLTVQQFGRYSNADSLPYRSTRSVPFPSPFRRTFRVSRYLWPMFIVFSVHNFPSRTVGVSWFLTVVARLRTLLSPISSLRSAPARSRLVHRHEASVSPNTMHCCASSKVNLLLHFTFSQLHFQGGTPGNGCDIRWRQGVIGWFGSSCPPEKVKKRCELLRMRVPPNTGKCCIIH